MFMICVYITLYLITCFNINILLSDDLVSKIYLSDQVYLPHAIIGWSMIREYGTALLYSIVSTSFNISSWNFIHRGSHMSAYVLLNLLNELGKRDKMRGLPGILSLFRSEFNKFNNTRARILDSIFHMTNTLKSDFWRKNVIILSLCTQRCYGRNNISRKSINH